ncbi:Condensin complex subunit [Lobulomyces angularis]|nr:Condensin complex subunit [Lobulomyces angularis]
MSLDFQLDAELISIHKIQPESELYICELDLPTFADDQKVSKLLDDILDAITSNDLSILEPSWYFSIKALLHNFKLLSNKNSEKLTDSLITAFSFLMDHVKTEESQINPQDFSKPLKVYALLQHWLIELAEHRSKAEIQELGRNNPDLKKKKKSTLSGAGERSRSKGNINLEKVDIYSYTWNAFKIKALDNFMSLLTLDLKRIIISVPDRQALISMLIKSITLIMDDADNLKITKIKMNCLSILTVAVIEYNSNFEIRQLVLQSLREEHLAEPMAKFFEILVENCNNNKLINEVLMEIKETELTDKDLKEAKILSIFLLNLSELIPKEFLKHMIELKNLLDSQSYTIRCCMLEVTGNLIQYLFSTRNQNFANNNLFQINSFYEILIERLRDKNAHVRIKDLHVLTKLAEANLIPVKPVNFRIKILSLAINRINDASISVRTNAIKLLVKLIETSPYVMFKQDRAKLSEELFLKRLQQIEENFKSRLPQEYDEFKKILQFNECPPTTSAEEAVEEDEIVKSEIFESEDPNENINKERHSDMKFETTHIDIENNSPQTDSGIENSEALGKLMLYYADGVKYCQKIKDSCKTMLDILSSNKKQEIIEAMNFFVTIHMFGMECSEPGIRRMVHKIWEKEVSTKPTFETQQVNNDGYEEKPIKGSIKEHLAKCYLEVFFRQYPSQGILEDNFVVAENLIKLTLKMSLAELTSLEQLIIFMVSKGYVEDSLVDTLWNIFGAGKKNPSFRRRGALIILSMMGNSNSDIIENNFDLLLKVGLGDVAKDDLLLARQTCVALQYLGKGNKRELSRRMPTTHPLFARLCDLMLEVRNQVYSWFSFAQEAVNVIYTLSEHPDVIMGEVIKKLSSSVFSIGNTEGMDMDMVTKTFSAGLNISESSTKSGEDETMRSENVCKREFGNSEEGENVSAFELSKLCFVVGHVAIKQIVYLELIESEWKQRKNSADSLKTPKKNQSDLDLVSGTVEDEFTEAINIIREKEILFGENSLLAVFGPLIVFICNNNSSFADETLQTIATLTLSKFMCISSEFCENNLRLLFTILEKCQDPITRSNLVIGLGDLAVSFNNLIDENIHYIYGRLSDSDLEVQKNTLMVLTHLILNGMVKVKGQISEIAKLIESKEVKLRDLSRLFFTELSTKDNSVYNNLPDIISNLSNTEIDSNGNFIKGVEEADFKKIMEFLFSFVKKAQHLDNLVEKLCLRFKNSSNCRQWRDIAFCLSLIPYSNEKSFRKFVEGLPYFQDKLHEKGVQKHFEEILLKGKKLKSTEMKILVEEFEKELKDLIKKASENEDTIQSVNKIMQDKVNKKKRKSFSNKQIPIDTDITETSMHQNALSEELENLNLNSGECDENLPSNK